MDNAINVVNIMLQQWSNNLQNPTLPKIFQFCILRNLISICRYEDTYMRSQVCHVEAHTHQN